ncbi:MAG: glycosyl hydrolase family 18 protein [Eubacteriales bacterium]|nr:glycosyl hydrolase family 18 protein [Eubacteriales bacterium]MDD4121464.1 glycosyl hydrolase family 18 protein [Eubacteriales bacterium]MDD4629001.1 glycosyl hydrolase family 18 protein [Eubacteriales bacterium]
MKNNIGSLVLKLAVFILVLTLGAATCSAADTGEKEIEEKEFKVIGYYSGDLFNEPLEKLQTDKLTHVIYAFLIPKEDGTLVDLEKPEQLRELTKKAHQDGAKVFIALGGWSYEGKPLYPVFGTVAASKEKRELLIDNICSLVKEYDLDGVEVDWEYPNTNTIRDYEQLILELDTALNSEGKELTAALNGAWSSTDGPEASKLVTDACLKRFDFISVMAYDMNNENHSPLWFAETSINYWLYRGIPAEKIVLGMPLYARPSWMQYRHLVDQNPEYAYADYAATEPLESYYNGINTLHEKTLIALRKAGGVMLFDVNEDTEDETSVVSMIDDQLTRTAHLSNIELNQHITIILDNKELTFLKEDGYGIPFIDDNNRTMLPFRKPVEAIGATVTYDEDNRTITAIKDNITVKLIIGQKEIYVNGKKIAMDTEAVIKDDRTYIPLRAVFNAFEYDVAWHGSSKTVYLNESSEPKLPF